MKKVHRLKTHSNEFAALKRGEKTAEFRKNDRDFREGDVLILEEWDPESRGFTGVVLSGDVTHLVEGAFGIPEGYCVMSVNIIGAGARQEKRC